MPEVDLTSVILRVAVGVTMLAHGWNHVYGGGKLPGTARWFASIGFRHSKVHALLASVGELAAGALLIAGLLTPLAAASVVGTMLVALIANHRKNGYFIFRPGEGYEYVLMITLVSLAIGAVGGGRISLDHALGMADDLRGWTGLAIAALAGAGGAALVLVSSWRPQPAPAAAPAAD
jgi:putative oxidoreductase